MIEEERKIITREKHPGRVARGHKLAALMKKRKEEILHNKKQSIQQQPVQSTQQLSVQSSVQSNDTYIYGVGMLAVLAIGVCVFFGYNNFQPKKQANEKKDQPPKRRHMR